MPTAGALTDAPALRVTQDQVLTQCVQAHGSRNWKKIAQEAFGGARTDLQVRAADLRLTGDPTDHQRARVALQCLFRWTQVLDPSVKKGLWTESEDQLLSDLVAKYGAGKVCARGAVLAAARPAPRRSSPTIAPRSGPSLPP